MTLVSAIRAYLQERRSALSPHTVRAYHSDLALLAGSAGGATVRRAVTPEGVRSFLKAQEERGLAPRSLRRRLVCIRQFGAWLHRAGHLPTDPCRDLRIKIAMPQQLPRSLTLAEASSLRTTAERHARHKAPGFFRNATRPTPHGSTALTTWLLIEVLLATGIRVGELTRIGPADLNLDDGVIAIHGKGNRERRVHLCSNHLRRQLTRYLTLGGIPRDHLLIHHDGRPLTEQDVRTLLRRTARNAGLTRKVTPHMLRHTAATLLLEHGLDIRHVQALLGHASITTTQRYTHVADNSLRHALERVQHHTPLWSTQR